MSHQDLLQGFSSDILVGGEWRAGTGKRYQSLYPADESVNAEIAAAGAEDAVEAVEAADAAWRRADWAGLKPHQRAAVLHRVADGITQRAEALAHLHLLWFAGKLTRTVDDQGVIRFSA